MASDLISRKALIEAMEKAEAHGLSLGDAQSIIAAAAIAGMREYIVQMVPAVDAVEVVHGRFELIEKAGVDYWRCPACQEIVAEYYHKPKYNYCPNCGAKMDGGTVDG